MIERFKRGWKQLRCKHEHWELRDDVFWDCMVCPACGKGRGLTEAEQLATRRSSVVD